MDEQHTSQGYVSDFDLLIIVNQKELTDRAAHWTKADERLIEERLAGRLRTPVNFVVHSLQQVNDALAHGRFFFMDIARDGIALFEADEKPLAEPKPKTPEANLALAREYFEEWMPSAEQFLVTARFTMGRGWNKKAAFLLHQAAENLYHCALLVCTFYAPHNHNLAFLRTQAERIDIRFVDAWPRDSRKERAMFAKLKEAYVKLGIRSITGSALRKWLGSAIMYPSWVASCTSFALTELLLWRPRQRQPDRGSAAGILPSARRLTIGSEMARPLCLSLAVMVT